MAKTITHDEKGNSKWGDEDHLQVSQNRSFASLIYELLSEKIPTESELKLFELILNLSIDHGPETPSAIETITAAKKGKTISEAVAAGILQINDSHGGAQEQLMEILYRINNDQLTIKNLVITDYLKEGKRMPGFGHRIYKELDPRAQLILKQVMESGLGDKYIKLAKQLEQGLASQTGKTLPLNIDGAIAVALCSLGWKAKLGKAVFIIARTPGLCGQFLNNQI